ncbi:hypothetical protein D3C87_249740 [compost metagenome]
MAIEYKNLENKNITQQQAQYLDYYTKNFIDQNTGFVKKIEVMENRQLTSISYYLDSGENENDIVQLYTDQVKDDVITIVRQTIQNNNIELRKQYNDKNLTFITHILYDNYNNIICRQNYNLITNQPIPETTLKYYYDYSDYTEEWGYREIFDSHYNSDGSLNILIYMPTDNDQDNESYGPINFSLLQDQFSEDLSYYLTSEFMPGDIT